MGPSASQHPGDEDNKIVELVKAMSFLQVAMKEPWAQKVLSADLSGLLGVPNCEVKDAMDGKPAGSAPKPANPPAPTRVPSPAPGNIPEKENKANPDHKDVPNILQAPMVPPNDPIPAATPPPSETTPAPGSGVPALAEATPPVAPAVINSSTHRAAHARLQRKMGSLTEAEAPNMHRLFNGSRKDWSL